VGTILIALARSLGQYEFGFVTVAQQLSDALKRKLEQQQAIAEELVHVDEELAAKALEVIENAEGAAQWLIRVLPILDAKKTPLELSRTPEGKAACLQALGRLDYGIFG
jgi:uncharacterized protein (DUF2384 family)